MGRTLDEVLAALPKDRQKRIETRLKQLTEEVEGLGELRRAAGKAQAEIAATLNIRQPSVSKIEKQADMYLSTLKNYVEAIGGQLDLIVRLPAHPPLRIERLGDVTVAEEGAAERSGKRNPSKPSARTRTATSHRRP